MRIFLLINLMCLSFSVYSHVPLNCPYKNYNPNKISSYHFITEYPDNLDPILNYEAEKSFIISQIYEPLYSVVFKERPFRIGPYLAAEMPKIEYFSANHLPVHLEDHKPIAYTVYTIKIKKNIFYQPHPGFCKILNINDCKHFKRELSADDFAYQIKRIGAINSHSPFSSTLAKFILGFKAYQKQYNQLSHEWSDLRARDITGVKVLDPYTLQIITSGYSSQWIFWLTMSFLSPMPWEIDKYHYQHQGKDGSWLSYSIGTGPYMLFNHHSKQQLKLQKNPNYRLEYYWFDKVKKRVPIVDDFYFVVEKETIPTWNKFLQGYADLSSIPAESYQNTIQINKQGHVDLAQSFKDKNIHLDIEQSSILSGIVFNFLDPVLGNSTLTGEKLRRALSIAFDFNEYRTIFRNGRGTLAHDPIPPSIMPNKAKILGNNNYIFSDGQHKSLQLARKLLKEAGYPNGINSKTKKPLVLFLDQISAGLPQEKALFSWFQKQAQKLGIQLFVRENDPNRYRKRLMNGDFQMTYFGWAADYPKAENFLMLFYGPNRHVKLEGPNWANFNDPEYNRLYQEIEVLPEGPERMLVFKQMIDILRKQSVWIWGLYGESIYLLHDWTKAFFMQDFSSGILKYYQIDGEERSQSWEKWNRPDFLPIGIFFIILVVLVLPFIIEKYRMGRAKARRMP